jgi:hypothetical protein
VSNISISRQKGTDEYYLRGNILSGSFSHKDRTQSGGVAVLKRRVWQANHKIVIVITMSELAVPCGLMGLPGQGSFRVFGAGFSGQEDFSL